jgi:RND family efflux transporter MFP subunit
VSGRAAVIVACLAVMACGRAPAEEVESAAVVAVKTAPAAVRDIVGVVHATGVVAPAPDADLVVVAPEVARIAEIPRAAGDAVRPGDLLVRFEMPGSAADVQKQQAETGRARAALEQARAAHQRASDLFERGIAARREVEESRRAAADAEAAVAQADAALAAARTLAGRAVVRATFAGIVAARQHNPGDLVEASISDPVMRVVDPHRLEVVASVPLADVSRVHVGAAARLDGSGDPGDGPALRVVSTPALVEPGTATVPVRLRPAGPLAAPVGAPVQIDIDAERHVHVVVVPIGALVREGDETAVFVAAGGKARRRQVRVGLADAAGVEIVSGVSAGEPVIVDGQVGLPDGAAIK